MGELIPGRKPCVNCGQCCREEVCPVGEIFMRTVTPPCPALAENNNTGKFWCGLIVCPEDSYVRPDRIREVLGKKIK